jgi:AmiR/NasT family two-component response regulator
VAPDPAVLRVLIASQTDDALSVLAQVVCGLGHLVIARTIDVRSAAPLTGREQPDVALVSRESRDDHALDMIDQIVHEQACPVIAVTSFDDPGFVLAAASHGVFAVVSMNDPASWQTVIDVLLLRWADLHRLRAAFDRRATIERANGILMERHAIAADAAFSMLREHARNGNLKVIDVAAGLIAGRALLPAVPGAPGARHELR